MMVEKSRKGDRTTEEVYNSWDDNEWAIQSGYNQWEAEEIERKNNDG